MASNIKVLIAVDGSENSMDAVRYAGHFFDPEETDMTLIHIMAELPDMTEDLKNIPSISLTPGETDAWYQKMIENAGQVMETAASILIDMGYKKATVHIIIRHRENGVAKDITIESGKGYDVLIIGRRGVNDPTDIIVGATAYRMMSAIEPLPIVMVGSKPDPRHILVGFDGSDNGSKVVACVCKLMPRPGREVLLCHISPAMNMPFSDGIVIPPNQEKQWAGQQNYEITELMKQAESHLSGAGFDPALIKMEILTSRTSRAVVLSKTAENHHCGTIVVGRRGLSMIREFMMGRVTMKVLHKAHQQAVWII